MDTLIDQPAGLGDIFFVQKICSVFSRSTKVYHPVSRTCWDMGALQLVSEAELGPIDTMHIPDGVLRHDLSNQPKPNGMVDTMVSKYNGLGIDWSDWVDYFHFHRDPAREQLLYNSLCDGPYILVNPFYGTPGYMLRNENVFSSLPSSYDGRIIELNPYIPGGRVFDWCAILESAEEIHSVDTSIQYIAEKLLLTASRLVVHPRLPGISKAMTAGFFSHAWEWVE